MQVQLYLEAQLPFKAMPLGESGISKSDSVVVRVPSTDEEGCLHEEYWYGIVNMLTKSGTWIKFFDIESGDFISEEKHLLKTCDYYDTWMRVSAKLD